MAEPVLGYDARWSPALLGPLWERERRARFLLLEAAAIPLSVDLLVWPSVFDYGIGIGLPAADRERCGLAGLLPPAWTGPNVGLWADVSALRAARPASGAPSVLVAVTWYLGDAPTTPGPVGPYMGSAPSAQRDPRWQLLGYDVADGSLVSGLSNCGYDDVERPGLQQAWAGALNQHHLFTGPTVAKGFRATCDARVPEHAPFFVLGLYAIEDWTVPVQPEINDSG